MWFVSDLGFRASNFILMDLLLGIATSAWNVFTDVWWLILPFILFFPLRDLWAIYLRDRTIKKMTWSLFQIKVPDNILKTPKAMEQVFASMYASYSHGINFLLKYIDGMVDDWYSFEIVGNSHGINFYVFAPSNRKAVVESAVYSQYPDAEVVEVEDYTELLPKSLPNKEYNLWGSDLKLNRESFYPINTYSYFEDAQEEKRLDPISAIAEVMSGLKENEWLWWQIVICPSDSSKGIDNQWVEEGEEKISELAGQKKQPPGPGFTENLGEWLQNLAVAPVQIPEWGFGKAEEKGPTFKFMNPSESDVAKAIHTKISKLGFDTTIRFIYIGPTRDFSSAVGTAVFGSIRQFNNPKLNTFGPGKELTLISGGNWKGKFIPFYKRLMLASRKKKIFSNYKKRKLRSKYVDKYRPSSAPIVTFSTEELATLYHFPTMLVKAPMMQRTESKRGGAPVNLPIVE